MNVVNQVHWLGHASFRIEDQGKNIYIDPWKLKPGHPKADLILITHSHYDHLSGDDVASLLTPKTVIAATPDCQKGLHKTFTPVEPGQTHSLASWKVESVPAYNLDKDFHPKKNRWVGYIVTLSTGERIFHAGDTDLTPDLKTVKADVALLPCGGTYTMTADEAADAANAMKPKVVIPMHWGDIVGSMADAEQVKKRFKGEVVIMTPE